MAFILLKRTKWDAWKRSFAGSKALKRLCPKDSLGYSYYSSWLANAVYNSTRKKNIKLLDWYVQLPLRSLCRTKFPCFLSIGESKVIVRLEISLIELKLIFEPTHAYVWTLSTNFQTHLIFINAQPASNLGIIICDHHVHTSSHFYTKPLAPFSHLLRDTFHFNIWS